MNLLLALLAAALAALCLTIEYYGLRCHVISRRKLVQLDAGMSSEKLRELLGEPTSVSVRADGSQSWLYASPLVWCLVRVHISPGDELVNLTHNH